MRGERDPSAWKLHDGDDDDDDYDDNDDVEDEMIVCLNSTLTLKCQFQ